jgi:hypothetical protein
MEHPNIEEILKEEVRSMDQRLSDLEEKMSSIDTKLTQVIEAILGNPLTKSGGVVNAMDVMKEKISMLEKKIEKHELFNSRISWTIGIVLALSGIVQFIVNMYFSVKR